MTGVDAIDRTVATTENWLALIAERTFTDEHHAYGALRAVLRALRDRLPVEVGAHVAAQLPLLVRGIFYEGWNPAHTPMRLSLEEFLDRVEGEAHLKGRGEAEDVTRAVFAVLWHEVGDGTMEHVMTVLPTDYAVVF